MSNGQPAPGIAVEMASRQREISVSEFFLKNRHLLGFDTPAKALVTAVKEAVDNALDVVKKQVHLVTRGARGAGVVEVINQLLDDDFEALRARRKAGAAESASEAAAK